MNTKNTKHTPGPWRINDDGDTIAGPSGARIAEVRIDHSEPNPVTQFDANARLIASAPDLLEALRALSVAVRDAGKEGTAGNLARAEAQALFAISKAEGVA